MNAQERALARDLIARARVTAQDEALKRALREAAEKAEQRRAEEIASWISDRERREAEMERIRSEREALPSWQRQYRNRPLQRAMCELLAERGEMPVRDLARELRRAPCNIHKALTKLVERGFVEKLGPGRYRVAA